MNLLGNTFVKADTKRLHKDLQAEFSDCHYVSGPLSPNRRDFARYDKAASSFDNRKRDQFCRRTDTMADNLDKCISYVISINK